MDNKKLIDKLNKNKSLEKAEWEALIGDCDDEDRRYAGELAHELTVSIFGKKIYFRGIIEFTNICKNDCYYCGIRASNKCASRYRLTEEEILECCLEGYSFGYRTFVLQGGEDAFWNDDRLCSVIEKMRMSFSDCAITLSVGERSRKSYERLFRAGANRYLLRHETADKEHYERLHPSSMSFDNRMKCLYALREIGYQTGAGMMVGAPYQTVSTLAQDMMLLADLNPHMVGIGPFIPHKDTPFCDYPKGKAELTLFLLSLTRLMLPSVLLPATTALGTVSGEGRQLGVLSGCNVVMPNLSPMSVRKKYMLYNDKIGTELDAKSSLELLEKQMNGIGYEVVRGRGDYKESAL